MHVLVGRITSRNRAGRSCLPRSSRARTRVLFTRSQPVPARGCLLADETLWQAALSPSAPADELGGAALDVLYDALGASLKAAIARGGVHTGEVVPHRRADGHCPRCGAEMVHGTVGGRTTWWCGAEQA